MKVEDESISEGMELLRKLRDFNCDRLDCPNCPLTAMEDDSPNPSEWCYSNQAADQLHWLEDKTQSLPTTAKEVTE